MIDSSNEFAVGVDIGGTNTKYGIVNHRGEIIEKGELRTDAFKTIEAFMDALHKVLSPIIEKHEKDGKVKGVGVGAPNGNYYTGTIEYAPNLQWKGIIPVAKLVTEKFGLPCALTNDANAAAVGEMNYGAARGMRDTVRDFGDWQGYGIRFNNADVNDITYSVGRAIDLYNNKRDLYNWMRSYMMHIDHSWDASSEEYIRVYESLQ